MEGDLVVPAVVAQQLHAGAVADHVGGRAGGGGPYLGGVLGGPAQRQREVGQRVPEGVSHDTHADMIVGFAAAVRAVQAECNRSAEQPAGRPNDRHGDG